MTSNEVKQLQKEAMKVQKAEGMKEKQINFVEESYFDCWDKIKAHNINLLKKDPSQRLFFLSSKNETIKGKPQLVQPTMKRIPLLRKAEKKEKNDQTTIKYKFLDDRFDKRYDGNQIHIMSKDFWIYRVVDQGKEYYILSQEYLENIVYVLRGMKIELDDFAEMSDSLRIKALSNVFILHHAEPSIKSWSKEKIIELTKALKIDYNYDSDDFIDDIFWYKNHDRIYSFSEDYNKLRVAQLLSSEYEGYPLHLFKIGPAGTGKTCEQECIDSFFNEEQGVLEGADSRPKVLEPSFKEKPASIGYIANCNRFAFIDELFKMIENEIAKSHEADASRNHLGSLNFLLEHKKRTVGSGNDNSTEIKATSKIFITSNPLGNLKTIYNHVGIIDPTTMSRILIWVQDEQEQEKALKKQWKIPENKKPSLRDSFVISGRKVIRDFSPYTELSIRVGGSSRSQKVKEFSWEYNTYNNTSTQTPRTPSQEPLIISSLRLESVYGETEREYLKSNNNSIINPFLTIYDSCQAFLSDFDEERVRKIVDGVTRLSREPMKSSIWKPRGLHHAILVLDGLVKFRCLFKDYDSSFKAKEEDYEELEKILVHMIKSWDTNLKPKEEN